MKIQIMIRTGRGTGTGGSGGTGLGPGVGSVIGILEMVTRGISVLAAMIILLLRSVNMTDRAGVGLLEHSVQVIEGSTVGVVKIHLAPDIVLGVSQKGSAVAPETAITSDRGDIAVRIAIATNRGGTPCQCHLHDVLSLLICRYLKVPILENADGLGHLDMH